MKKVGILYHHRLEAAQSLAREVEAYLQPQAVVWCCPAGDEERARKEMPDTKLLLSLGGDGTILRAARAAAPWSVPILGVNLGRLGFMTELTPEALQKKLPPLLAGKGWMDERAMLQAEFKGQTYHALNDVVVGRKAISQVVYIRAWVDGEELATYKADGLIVASATGSTGYALSAGGPILYPQSQELLLQPISAHLSWSATLVLPPQARVELEVGSERPAMLSVDGQVNIPLKGGDRVVVKRSPYVTRLLRVEPLLFFKTLNQRLSAKKV